MRRLTLLTLALSPLLIAGAPALALAAPAQEAVSEFGAPVIVNGEQVPDLEIKRFLAYGVGGTVVETDRLQILIDRQLENERRGLARQYSIEVLEGRSVSELSDAERTQMQATIEEGLAPLRVEPGLIEWTLERYAKQFAEAYPTLDYRTETARVSGAAEWYELQIRKALEFDACFFPGEPANWPEITKQALYAKGIGRDVVMPLKEAWDQRAAQAKANGEKFVARDDQLLGALRDNVIDGLTSGLRQEMADDNLPPQLLVRMRGDDWSAEIATEDVWTRIQPFVTATDIATAKRWLAMMHATQGQLAKEGHLMSPDAHAQNLARIEQNVGAAGLTLEYLALTSFGFPSTQSFRGYMHLFESFRNSKLAEGSLGLTSRGTLPPSLEEFLSIAGQSLLGEVVNVEVLLVAAFDEARNRWKKDGWPQAQKRAEHLRAEIDQHLDKLATQDQAKRKAAEEGVNWEADEVHAPFEQHWTELRASHNELADRSAPDAEASTASQNGSVSRDELAEWIGETSFTKTLTGRSIADHVFVDLGQGAIGGPFRGPKGYYFVYVKSRAGGHREFDTTNTDGLKTLEQEYLKQAFAEYANRALRMAETSGIPEV